MPPGFVHVHSHGIELPADASGWTFAEGFLAVTGALLVVGVPIVAVRRLRKRRKP